MSDTELAYLECGPRVAAATLLTDARALAGMGRYLAWRHRPALLVGAALRALLAGAR
jgi:hypothetical protein